MKLKVEYLHKKKVVQAGELELIKCADGRAYFAGVTLPVVALTERTKEELNRLLKEN